jgi:tRNA1(Val) A37 N6-methylase TrmN6
MYIGYYLNYTSSGEDYTNFINKINNTRLGENMVSIAEHMKKEGEFRNKIQMAKNLLKEGCDLSFISRVTKLSFERIKKLQ